MIVIEDGTLHTEVPELAEELVKRVVVGILKAVRLFAATQDGPDDKKVHATVPILDSCLYIGPELSPAVTVVNFDRLEDLCKKKSALRGALPQVSNSLCTELNYTLHNSWLKMHEKNVRVASFGQDGIRLTVATDIVELDLQLSYERRQYATALRESINSRTSPEFLCSGPHHLTLEDSLPDSVVLQIFEDRIDVVDILDLEFTGIAQARIKPAMFRPVPLVVHVYNSRDNTKLIRFTTDLDTMTVDQYLRVLQV